MSPIGFDEIICIFNAAAVKPNAIMYLEQVFVEIIFCFRVGARWVNDPIGESSLQKLWLWR